jgi:molybdopterin/thiamine biosynthesis adenylyltransferase
VKPEHAPYRLAGGAIRIGGGVYGVAAEVADPTGAVWALLRAADGSRTPDEIVARVLSEFPAESAEAVLRALDQFEEAGYLDDAAAPDPAALSERERERYSRGRLFYRWIDLRPGATGWEPQLLLRAARMVVVGLGGTGGAAASALAASGVGRLHCVDSDTVGLSNLNRQLLYTEADLGRSKVDVAVERLRALNSDIEVTGERLTITGVDDLAGLVKGCDVLVLCADRPGEIRSWANRACLDAGTPWVDAGYHGPVATASAYRPGDGACYECMWRTEFDRRRATDPTFEYAVARGSSNAVIAPSAGLSGHLAAHLATALLTGVPAVTPARLQGVNLLAADHHFVADFARHADCPACG